jgi:hypothetical protein
VLGAVTDGRDEDYLQMRTASEGERFNFNFVHFFNALLVMEESGFLRNRVEEIPTKPKSKAVTVAEVSVTKTAY